jgi:hypothetical protein
MHTFFQKNAGPEGSAARFIARIIREILARECFERYADLSDVLKFRLARLRVRWTNDDINAALALVESNTCVLVDAPPLPRRTVVEERPQLDTRPFSRDEAATKWAEFLKDTRAQAVKAAHGRIAPRRMPSAAPVAPRVADHATALGMVLQEIRATRARCAALERE